MNRLSAYRKSIRSAIVLSVTLLVAQSAVAANINIPK